MSTILPKCTLNGALAFVAPSSHITVGIQKYPGENSLRELREQHRGKYYFKRDKDTLLSVALQKGALPIGDTSENRDLSEQPWLLAPLLTEALLNMFSDMKRPVLKYRPLHILTTREQDRLLRTVDKDHTFPDWLDQRVSFEFDTRLLKTEGPLPRVLLACDARSVITIGASCDKLLSLNIPIEGLYVQSLESRDPRLTPMRRTIGRVNKIHGTTLLLDDHGEHPGEIDASAVYLEPRFENFRACVRSLAGSAATGILNRLAAENYKLNTGPGRLNRVRDMMAHLSKNPPNVVPGVSVALSALLRQGTTEWFSETELMKRPRLWFDPSGTRTDERSDLGIDVHGPYDNQIFTPKELNIAVVCQPEVKGQVETFIKKFRDGMPDVRVGNRAPYGRGFVLRYMLQPPRIKFFMTEGGTADDYASTCAEAVSFATERGIKWHLAMVQIREAFKDYPEADDPYLAAKSIFMRRQIPVQELTLEKMQSADTDLAYILSDVSLAAYAKAGGTPWLLPANATVAHELVIGLGSAEFSSSRLGAKDRNVGITTIFSGDGRYLLEGRTGSVPFDKYSQSLLKTLDTALKKIRSEQNWGANDSVRLIFHVFKPLRDAEVEAVVKVVKGLSLPNAEFAFVHVIDDHPLLLFDEAQSGIPFKGRKKGEYAPPRGLMVRVTDREALVALSGPREVKEASHGMPRPLALRLHKDSTFTDMLYLSRQVHAFAGQSWRGFRLSSVPITILYSQLIARMLRRLQERKDWDSHAMLDQIGLSRWFL